MASKKMTISIFIKFFFNDYTITLKNLFNTAFKIIKSYITSLGYFLKAPFGIIINFSYISKLKKLKFEELQEALSALDKLFYCLIN